MDIIQDYLVSLWIIIITIVIIILDYSGMDGYTTPWIHGVIATEVYLATSDGIEDALDGLLLVYVVLLSDDS